MLAGTSLNTAQLCRNTCVSSSAQARLGHSAKLGGAAPWSCPLTSLTHMVCKLLLVNGSP